LAKLCRDSKIFYQIGIDLIDFLNKTIPGGGKKQPGGGKKIFSRFARNLAPPWLKSCVRACQIHVCPLIKVISVQISISPGSMW